MKLGAGPPCNMDIPIAFPHVLKSPAFRATVELTGFPSLKYLSLMMINNSEKQKQKQMKMNYVKETHLPMVLQNFVAQDKKIIVLILKGDKHMRN